MHPETSYNSSLAATAVLIASFNGSLATSSANWAIEAKSYSVAQAQPTFSEINVENKYIFEKNNTYFKNKLEEIFVCLADKQEVLGEEFENIWSNNLDLLYQD